MPSFKDAQGREWDVRIDAPVCQRIREDVDAKFLLRDSDSNNTYSRLQDDPVLLCRVLYLLCDKQRESRKVTEEDFYGSLAGDVIDSATDAMLRAIVSFTPRRTRELLEAFAAKTDKLQQLAVKRAIEKINDPNLETSILTKFEGEIDRAIQEALMPSSSATSSPDS